jgi:hypothetical protein
MMAETLTALTEGHENVLALLGHGHGACLRPELDEALDGLVAAGLVTFKCFETPALTAAGWEAFDRLDAKGWDRAPRFPA